MNKLVLAFAAGLTLAGSGIAIAQPDEPPANSTMPSGLSADQKSQLGSWTEDQRTAYRAWTQEMRDYYWTLTPTQRTGWWRLTEAQRGQVFALDEAGRANAWRAIEAQLAGAAPDASAPAQDAPVEQVQANPPGPGIPSVTPPNPETAAAAVPPAMPADPGYQAGPYKGALTQPPAQAMNKDYPLCSRTIKDSCINPSEAGASRQPMRSRSIRKRRAT